MIRKTRTRGSKKNSSKSLKKQVAVKFRLPKPYRIVPLLPKKPSKLQPQMLGEQLPEPCPGCTFLRSFALDPFTTICIYLCPDAALCIVRC